MYSISLLPSEYKYYINASKRNSISIFIALAVSGFLIAVFTILSIISAGYDNELSDIQSQNSVIEKQITKLKPIELLQSEFNSRMQQLTLTAGLSPKWEEVIATIGNSVPASIGLDYIQSTYKDLVGVIVIKGKASKHTDVALWMKDLQLIEGMGEVTCNFSEKVLDTNSVLPANEVEFELNIPILSGTPYDLKVRGDSNDK